MTVKLKDIARETGVSISTVSRILNNDTSRKAGDKTAARVMEAAQKLGFFSQSRVRHLPVLENTDKKPYSIGCILTSDHETFVSPFFSKLLAAIQNELAKTAGLLQYNFFVANIKDPGFSRFLTTDRLDCAIMLGRTSQENISLLKQNIPHLVYAGANRIGGGIDEIICDGYEGARCAVNYFISLGHTEIGFIGPTQQKYQVVNEHRYNGFMDAMKKAGLTVNPRYVADTILTSADGYDSAAALIKSGNLPTAVFCANDTVALGAMRAFNDNNILIPEDISLMGFDNIDMVSYVKPALTTISVPTGELGRFAVKILLDKIETGRKYPIRLDIPFELVVRESCRNISGAEKED